MAWPLSKEEIDIIRKSPILIYSIVVSWVAFYKEQQFLKLNQDYVEHLKEDRKNTKADAVFWQDAFFKTNAPGTVIRDTVYIPYPGAARSE